MPYRSEPKHYELGPHATYTWTATFNLGAPTSHHEIIAQLGTIAQRFDDPTYGISGAMRGRPNFSSSVLLALDPSRTYGTPSLATCEEIAGAVEELPGWTRKDPTRIPEHRIIMGRREGYAETARERSYAETLGLARVYLAGQHTSTEQAQLFSIRHIPEEGLRTHHEPAVIIDGSTSMLEGALECKL